MARLPAQRGAQCFGRRTSMPMTPLNTIARLPSGTRFSRMRRFYRGERGSVFVEAALVLPIILILCFGTIQYSLALVANGNMYDAARQAARKVAVGSWTPAEARTNIAGMLVDWPTNWTINVVRSGDEARVTITVPGAEAGILSVVPMPATFSAEVIMRMEVG